MVAVRVEYKRGSLLTLSVVLLTACAARQPQAASPSAGPAPFQEHALRAKAAQTETAGAAREATHAPTLFKDLQLSTGNLSSTEVRDGQGTRVALRFGLERPWQVSAVRDSLRADHEATSSAGEQALQAGLSETCSESASAHALDAERSLYATYRQLLERAGKWAEAWKSAGTLEPLSASRSVLFIQRHLWSDMPSPLMPRTHATLGALPSIAQQSASLSRDPQFLLSHIAGRPEVQAHLAGSRKREALAAAERGSRLPWLEVLQVGYPRDPSSARDVQARVGVGFPLADGSRGRAERAAFGAQAEQYRAESEAARLLRVASLQLDVLERFESEAPHLQRLQELSDQSDAVALTFLNAQMGEPDKVAQLLSEAYAVRRALLAARADAARAACELERATGIPYTAWPRATQAPTQQ
jgi:hypothetical protein